MARGENALNEKNAALGLVRHGDGWGGVVVQDGAVRRIRSASPCWSDSAFATARSSTVRLLHARLASSGAAAESNAHPFQARIRGETWFFCHNGTLRDEPGGGTGATDSERFFRRLTGFLERDASPVAAFESAASGLRDITALDAFLLGSAGLWAFCVRSDPSLRRYYTLVWAETRDGVVVSSEPLHDVSETWIPMENGTALCVSIPPGERRTLRLRLPAELTPVGG